MSQKTSELFVEFIQASVRVRQENKYGFVDHLSSMKNSADQMLNEVFDVQVRNFAYDVMNFIRAFAAEKKNSGYFSLEVFSLDGDFAFLKTAYLAWEKIATREYECSPFFVDFYVSSDMWVAAAIHIGTTDSTKIACYRDYADISRDRVMLMKPARWFAHFMTGSEHDALNFNNKYIGGTTQSGRKVHFLSSLQTGCSPDNWEKLYANTSTNAYSCMTKVPQCARVYAYDDTLDAVYVTDTGQTLDENPTVVIIGRTIIRKDKMKYIRLYQTDYKIEEYMKEYLRVQGYECDRDMGGAKLAKIPYQGSDNKFVFPYIDGGPQGISDQGSYFMVEEDSRTYDDDDDDHEEGIAFYADNPSGYVMCSHPCKHCGAMIRANDDDNDYTGYVTTNDSGELVYMEACNRCEVMQGSRLTYVGSGIYANDENNDRQFAYYVDTSKVECTVYMDRWCDVQTVRVGKESPSHGYVQITCPNSLKHNNWGEKCTLYVSASYARKLANGHWTHKEWAFNPLLTDQHTTQEELDKCWFSKHDRVMYDRLMSGRYSGGYYENVKNILRLMGILSGEYNWHVTDSNAVAYVHTTCTYHAVKRNMQENLVEYSLQAA